MQVFNGKSVCSGIAIGKIKLHKTQQEEIKPVTITDADSEIQRYESARQTAVSQLAQLYEKAVKDVGEKNAAIFEIHQMMLEDDDYNDNVKEIISQQMVNAEYAVSQTRDSFAQMFSDMDDEYMKERAADVKDISRRLIDILSDKQAENSHNESSYILFAYDLAPSETLQLDKDKVLSFVTVGGSQNSHTAILAKTMAIPSLVNSDMPLDDSLNGKLAVVDGNNGKIYVEPSEDILSQMEEKYKSEQEQKMLLQQLKGKESITADGQKVLLYANIGNIKDLDLVMKNGAEGIGLFRSEFIYLERDNFPTEEEQFEIYKTVAQTLNGKRVIIRTLDIGADKQCDYFGMEKEENPALGCRAIRICLTRPEIFKTQLRALLRASVYGKIAIMYPMITSVKEVLRIKEIVNEVKQELTNEGYAYSDVEQGIMIETPASAIISDLLAKEVDFFSIGTNDLVQYTLAVDRQNEKLDWFCDTHHPAILRMISNVVKNAHDNGIWAAICGEMGADTSLTKEFLAMGVDELSVSPGKLLPVRKIILETDVAQYKQNERNINY